MAVLFSPDITTGVCRQTLITDSRASGPYLKSPASYHDVARKYDLDLFVHPAIAPASREHQTMAIHREDESMRTREIPHEKDHAGGWSFI